MHPGQVADPTATLLVAAFEFLERPEPGVARIAVGHGGVDSQPPDRLAPRLVSLSGLERTVADGLISYVALGDSNSVTDLSASGAVWYSGAPLATAERK